MRTTHKAVLFGNRVRAFTPSDIATLAAWYDKSDAATLFQDSALTTPATNNGDVIGGWKDKTANVYHALQATTTNKPTLQAGGIRFDGTDNYLSVAFGTTYAQSNEFIAVIKMNDITGTKYLFGGINTNNRHEVGSNGSFHVLLGGSSFTTTIAPSTSKRIYGVIFNGASSSFAINGGAASTGNPGAQGITGLTLGARFDLGAWGAVDISEFCFFSDTLSDANRTSLISYLNSKWSVF